MYLNHITYALSDQPSDLSTLCERGEFSKNEALFFEKMMGLKYISRMAHVSTLALIEKTLSRFFSESQVNKKSVKYFLFAHTSDCVAPFEINITKKLLDDFELDHAISFSATINKCATIFHLLKISKSLFTNLQKNEQIILLIADSTFTKILRTIPGSTVLGDAATVLLLSKQENQSQFIDALIETDGRFASGNFASHKEQLLFQSIYVQKLGEIILSIVNRNSLSIEQIKYIFPHNVNLLSWYQVAAAIHMPIEKIYLKNISKTGHCFGSDPFINLKDGISAGLISPGDYYLLVTVGLGATFSAILFQY